MTVELFDISDVARLEEALAIRLRVFVEEQGVPLDLEIDDHDRSDDAALHVLIRDDDDEMAIATGRFYDRGGGCVQIGRMAVLPKYRGRGLGARLLEVLLEEARRLGFHEARLDAQTQAVDFYRRAGFSDDGPQHLDAGILHQPMRRLL